MKKNNAPLISVIIPTYNQADLIINTLNSVINQTYRNIEIIICDDGSTDNTQALISQINDSRIIWITGNNTGGPASPRNKGIMKAKGDWLAFLDGDDIWLNNKLEQQMAIISQKNQIAVCTNAKVLKNKKILSDNYFKNDTTREITFKSLSRINYIICSSMLINKQLVISSGLFPEKNIYTGAEDYALWLVCSLNNNIYYLSTPLVIYRDEEKNSVRGKYKKNPYTQHLQVLLWCNKQNKKISSNSIMLYMLTLKNILGIIKTNIRLYFQTF